MNLDTLKAKYGKAMLADEEGGYYIWPELEKDIIDYLSDKDGGECLCKECTKQLPEPTPQADWVKELLDIQSDISDTICGCYGDDWKEEIFKENAEKMIVFISKVESLAQQRTEKKWREPLEKVIKIVKLDDPVATHIDDEPLNKQAPIVIWGRARNSLRENIREALSDLLTKIKGGV